MKYPNIDAERARHGLTTEDLANTLGVTRKTFYNWYNQGKIPRSALEQMSVLFAGCSVDYLSSKVKEETNACKNENCAGRL